jgi:hypothetical protein
VSKAYEKLLNDVCVRLGFCGSIVNGEALHVDMLLPEQGTIRANDWVDAVLQAEGFDPKDASLDQFRRSIRDAFIEHLGSDKVDVQQLK